MPEAMPVLLGASLVVTLIGLVLLWQSRAKAMRAAEEWRSALGDAERGLAELQARHASLSENHEALRREHGENADAARRVAILETEIAAERKATEEKLAAERGAVAENLAIERKAVEEKFAAERKASEERLATVRQAAEERLAAEREAAQEKLAAERKAGAEKVAFLRETREQMTGEFRELADKAMRRQGEDFRKSAGGELEKIVAPLKQNIGTFEREMKDARTDAVKERAALKEQLGTLTERSIAVSRGAETLAKALRGDQQRQGAWGEAILSRLLEMAGMAEGREFVTQQSFTTEEGARQRPDVLVRLPGEKELVIDSKVSLKAYDEAVNSDDDGARSVALSRHVASLQSHIKGLASKDYSADVKGSADYVIMFVPIEGALSEALRAKDDLAEFALERQVMIATPTTLMMALRTIRNLWDVERRSENAEAIADRAGRLYDKVHGFVADLEQVGKQLESAQRSHQEALAKLSSGRGNVLRQVEMLKDLGAKTQKSLSSTLLIEAEAPSGSE